MVRGIVLPLVLAAGCATSTEYVLFRPAGPVTQTVAGRPATTYPVPPGQPQGRGSIAALGLARVQPSEGPETDALHVRLVLDNRGDAPWLVDTRDVVATLPGHGSSRPAFVNTNAGGPPVVTVPPGARRTIDLFYPLPDGLDEAAELPGFAVRWAVQTPGATPVYTTSFVRQVVEPVEQPSPYALVTPGIGFYPYWYYDPLYPRLAFVPPARYVGYHRRLYVTPPRVVAPPPRTHVARPPRHR